MNLWRGFIRLWVVASLIWVAWIAFDLEIVSALSNPIAFGNPVDVRALKDAGFTQAEIADWALQSHLTMFAKLAFLPPIAGLLIGLGIWWAVNGFRSRPKSN